MQEDAVEEQKDPFGNSNIVPSRSARIMHLGLVGGLAQHPAAPQLCIPVRHGMLTEKVGAVRFSDATQFVANTKVQHPCFTTTSHDLGIKKPQQVDMPVKWRGKEVPAPHPPALPRVSSCSFLSHGYDALQHRHTRGGLAQRCMRSSGPHLHPGEPAYPASAE